MIFGTAGHIDHGKTSLVKLLTGTDCDRLPEEKARGITIELGFASMDLPDGTHLGVVDVPGHERFVRTMVAGASGIDIIMLVIAADEGVMPQTREHFEICRLLGVGAGLVALTKRDLVDADWLALVTEDVRQFVKGSFLEGAPVAPVSSTTGEGRDALIEAIATAAQSATAKNPSDIFRLPADRVFTMKGFGTVVTGTLLAGTVKVGDDIEILPSGVRSRVRGLQVHGRPVESAGAGLRTAVNLQGTPREAVRRGEIMVAPGALEPTYMTDARVTLLSSAPRALAARSRVRFHVHTQEIWGRVYPMSAQAIEPGGEGVAQIRLESPAVMLPGDRFVLRGGSPVATLGGGVVLHAKPAKHRAPWGRVLADLEVLENGGLSHRMTVLYRNAGYGGLAASTLPGLLGASSKEIAGAYQNLLSRQNLVRFDADGDRAMDAELFTEVLESIVRTLTEHHASATDSPGMTRGELAARVLYGIEPRLLNRALTQLLKDGKVEVDGDVARLPGHRAGFSGEMAKLTDKIRGLLQGGKFSPPTVKELIEAGGGRKGPVGQILDHLINAGEAVRVSPTLFYDTTAFEEIKALVQKRLAEAGEIDAPSFKDLTGLSRKFAIPLLEYFDAIKLTLRVGDKRVPRKTPAQS